MLRKYLDDTPLHKWVKSHIVVSNALLGLLYFVFANLGFILVEIPDRISYAWPATGLAFTAVFIGGFRVLPGISIGAFIANTSTGLGPSTHSSSQKVISWRHTSHSWFSSRSVQ